MISFRRTKKRSYQTPGKRYFFCSAAGVFSLLLILTLVGFMGKGRLQYQLNETQDMLASSIAQDMNKAMASYEGINRKSANLADDILPTMRRHLYAAYEMNRVLTKTYGEEYSMIDAGQYEAFEEIMDQFDGLLAAGQSTDPAKENLALCMEGIKSSLANRFTAEGNLLPKTASATTSSQP